MATKKVKLNQNNGTSYDLLHPETETAQVVGLTEELAKKVNVEVRESYPSIDNSGIEKLRAAGLFAEDYEGNESHLLIGTIIDKCKDSHNLGYIATTTAVTALSATGKQGDYCINGETDSIWVYDVQTSKFIDTDRRGQVTSVNGETGAVTIPTYTLPTATATRLGGVKIGTSMNVQPDGTINAKRQVVCSATTPTISMHIDALWVQPVE